MPDIDLSLNPVGVPPNDGQEIQIRDALGIDRALNVADPTADSGVEAAVGTLGYTNETPPRYFKKFGLLATDWVRITDQAALDLKADQTAVDLKADQTAVDLKADQTALDELQPTPIASKEALYALTGLTGGERYETPDGGIYRYLGDGESLSTSWAVESRPQTSEFIDTLMQQPSKRYVQDLLTVPLAFAAFTHTLTQDEWRKAAKFTSTKTSAISATVKSSTGHALIINFDGTKEAVAGGGPGTEASNFTVASKAPVNTYSGTSDIPKFYAIYPCDAAGNVSGDLTYLNFSNNQLTSFDGTGLTALTSLTVNSNQLTSFDGTGMTALTYLYANDNQLTSFDGTGLTALTSLSIEDNQLTSFVGTGMTALTSLGIENNQLTSFDGTELTALTNLHIYNNQLTSFAGTGMTALTTLSISNNQLTSFDGTGMPALTNLRIDGNQLESCILVDFPGINAHPFLIYTIDLSYQNMTTDAVYLMLDSILSPAVDQPYPINLTGSPCDDTVTGGANLVDGATYTAAQVEALLTTKGYEIQVTDGTITG